MPCPRTQQANLPACSPQPPLNAERQTGKQRMPFFKVFWYESTRGMNLRSTECEVDALTTTPSRRIVSFSTNFSTNRWQVRVHQPSVKQQFYLLLIGLSINMHLNIFYYIDMYKQPVFCLYFFHHNGLLSYG